MKQLLWAYCFICFFAIKSSSQHLDVTTYYPRDGASVIGANNVSQDKNGWIWLTDGHKLMRYDGNRIKSFYPVVNSGMDNIFGALNVGEEIWVQARPRLLKLAADSLVPLDVSDNTIDLINALQYKSKQFILERNGLYILNKRELQKYILDSSLDIGDYARLIPYSDTLLLAYETNKSLVIFNLNQHSFHRVWLPVFDLQQAPNGEVYYFLKEQGLFLLKSLSQSGDAWKENSELFCRLDYKEKRFGSFIIDRRGNFWLFEQMRWLMKITREKKISTFTESSGLPGVWFFRMIADKDNNIWLGMHGTFAKISQPSFERFTKEEGLYFNHVLFITTDDSGRAYIGTQKGLNVYKDEKLYKAREDGEAFHCTYLLKREKKIYFTRDSTLFSAEMENSSYTIQAEKKLTRLPGQGMEMIMDKEGSIFISTNRGLYAWYKNRLFTLIPDLQYYRKIFLDKQGRLWTGIFSAGVSSYEISYEKGFPELKPIISINRDSAIQSIIATRAITQDNEGNILIGTRFRGLFYLKMEGNKIKEIKHYQKKDGLGSDVIWSLAKDSRGHIWIGHDLGLNRIYWLNDKLVIEDESKQKQIYLTYQVVFDGKKSLWVSSYPGLVKFDISAVQASDPFSVFITSITAEGNQIYENETEERPRFDYQQNTFNIEFSSNSFLDEKAIAYSYRLVKYGSEKWSNPSPVHLVNYSSLLPGQYQFQVRALGTNGRWSENTATYSFEILPPFWQRTWFLSAAALFFILALYFIYRYRIAQILKLQQMRNNISRNLHDDIGASLSNINILNELASRNINETAKVKNYLQQSGDDIQRISESLSDIVWNINPRYDQIGNLFARMKRYAADMMDGRQIETEFVFPADENNLQIPMDKRRDFYLIFKEAVNNLVKYSGATKAIVEVKTGSHKLVLKIEDNGIGFQTRNNDKGNGLQNMRERAKKWDSSLHIISEPGKGTRVILEMKT